MPVTAAQATAGLPGLPMAQRMATTMAAEADIWRTLRWNILAAPGKGKTHLSATASRKYCGPPWPSPSKPVVLDDVYFLTSDPGGMLGLREKGFDAPELNISEWSDQQVFSSLEDIPKHITAEVKARGIRLVSVDTVDAVLGAVLNVLAGADKKREGPALYNAFGAEAGKFLRGMMRVPCPVVYNCHIAAPQVKMQGQKVDNSEYVEATMLAAGAEDGQLLMDIGGKKAAKVLRNAATNMGHLRLIELPGKVERTIYFEDEKVENKRRLTEAVGKIAPAHFGQLFEKIATHFCVPLL